MPKSRLPRVLSLDRLIYSCRITQWEEWLLWHSDLSSDLQNPCICNLYTGETGSLDFSGKPDLSEIIPFRPLHTSSISDTASMTTLSDFFCFPHNFANFCCVVLSLFIYFFVCASANCTWIKEPRRERAGEWCSLELQLVTTAVSTVDRVCKDF